MSNGPRNKWVALFSVMGLAALALVATSRLTGRAAGAGGEESGGCGGAPGAVGSLGQALVAAKDLGELDEPGKTLGGSVQRVAPGGSLVFTVREDPLRAILGVDASDGKAVSVFDDELQAGTGAPGSTSLHRFTFAVAPSVPPGTTIHVATMAAWQSRTDPVWSFGFDLAVGP